MITQISASAGSGKTYSLTRLFLQLLENADALPLPSGCALHGRNHGYSLAEILAATFTNKAATEMKNRVVSTLKEDALKKQAGENAGNNPGNAAAWVERILRHYGALNIRTIDSLLTALVRLSALELDLPPDFTPAFDPGEYFSPLYDALMEDLAADGQLLDAVTSQAGTDEHGLPPANETLGRDSHFSESLPVCPEAGPLTCSGAGSSVFSGTGPAAFLSADPAALRADLLRACRSLLFLGDSRGFTPGGRLHDQVLELVHRLLTGQTVPRMDEGAIFARLEASRKTLTAAAGFLRRLLDQERLNAQARFLTFLDACARLPAHGVPPVSAYADKRELDECLNKSARGKASEDVLAAYADFAAALAAYSTALPLLRQALRIAPLTGLALEIHRRMLADRFSNSLLPALSLPFLAGRALSGEYGVSDALCRLGTRLSHLLLDEFQDTSREQWAAILPLVVESLSTGGGLTYVGDPKQAIYGWRGGDARLFDQAEDEPELLAMAPKRETIRLAFNWRSHPLVVAHNNAFFGLLHDRAVAGQTLAAMLPKDTPDTYRARAADEAVRVFSGVEQSIPPEKDWTADPRSSLAAVRLYLAEAETADAVRELVRERLRVLFLEELLPAWRCGDIAVLVRSGAEGALVAGWLTDWGLPVVTQNSFLLSAHPLVNRLVSLLAFLDYPPDDLAFWEVASALETLAPASGVRADGLADWLARTALAQGRNRPPLYQLFRAAFPGIWDACIAPFHSGAGLMSAYDTLREAVSRFGLLERMPGQAPFLLRLLEIAHLAETRGHSSLAAFLTFWRACRDNEQLPLPEGMDAVRIMTVHKAKGLEFPVVVLPFQHQGKRRDPELVRIRHEGLDLLTRAGRELPDIHYPACITDELERLNLLYVAWTRPVYALHSFITRLSGRSSPLQRGLETLVAAHKERAAPGLCQWETLGEAEPRPELAAPEQASPERPEQASPERTASAAADPQTAPWPEKRAGEYAEKSARERAEEHTRERAREDAGEDTRERTPWRPMNWLPRLKIYRSSLEDARFTPARRGILAHLCLEHLLLSDPGSAQARVTDVRRAVRQGMRLFPLPVENPESVAGEMEDCLFWFAFLPEAPSWLAHGLRERGVIDANGDMHRVDLLVDEALYAENAVLAGKGDSPLFTGMPEQCPPSFPDESSPHTLRAIDYKTGRFPVGEAREEHHRQVRRYMRLVARARGRRVRGTLVYLDERRLEEVEL